MEQKKLLSLGILLLLALQLLAQTQPPELNLKSGDWFETTILITNATKTVSNNFDLRYKVSPKSSQGNLVFEVSIDRMRLKYADAENIWWGYDSNYPPYAENRKKGLTKQLYEIKADNHGKISALTTLAATQDIDFSLISVKTKSSAPKKALSVDMIFPIAQLKQVSEVIISSLLAGKALAKTIILSNSGTGGSYASAVLKSASFKIPKNAVIKGNITNLSKRDSIYAVNDEIFRFKKDGSFSANVSAGLSARRRWIFGEFDHYKTFSILLEPLDTLIVNADALDFDNTVSFAGNAGAKASLSKDLVSVFDNQWVNKSIYRSKSPEEFLSFQRRGQNDLEGIINKYATSVASEILNQCRTDFKYVQAGTKLAYLTHNRNQLKPNFAKFPEDFFLSIDTLPITMSGREGGLYYDYYLRQLLPYQQTKLSMVNANQYGFFADYATAIASFDGYPLYFGIFNSLKKELYKSEVESTERLKIYYEDFISNCGDTTFTNQLKEIWTEARLWLPGNPSPVKSFLLKDGTALDLAKFKGKPLVLIVNFNNPDVLRRHIALIKKQNGSQVHFVIAQRLSSLEESTMDQKLKDLPNVTYVELHDDLNKQQNFNLFHQQTKVFTFNSDFKVISSYLFDQDPGVETRIKDLVAEDQVMREMIKNAIDSGVMTKEQKASIITTVGWSVCSALLASIVIFSIYRARIASLRKKTQLQNKIKDLEIKAIRSQMNPHFMFNALNSIQSLINDQQYKQANVYLEKFSLLMRRVLNNSEKSFVPLSDELDAIVLYCELEQLRFNFKFEIERSADLNSQLIEIPGMIIQPLVENAILHGLARQGESGRLVIFVSSDQRYLKIVVKDNGAGLKVDKAEQNKGFGLKLVRERLVLLNTGGSVGELQLSSNLGENQRGVTAVLTIPID